MSKKLISLTLAILFVVGLFSIIPPTAAASNGPLESRITINYVNETIEYRGTERFVMFALNSGALNADDKVKNKERWQVANVVGGVAEIDISRVIPRKVGKNPYNIAFKLSGNDASRTVVEIDARPPNRDPSSGDPDINIGRPRGGVGVFFLYCDNFSTIVNSAGTDIVVRFPAAARPASLANKEFELISVAGAGKCECDNDDIEDIGSGVIVCECRIKVPTHLINRNLQFTANMPAIIGDSFSSVPVRMALPAQPRAPAVRQTFVKNDTTGASLTLNFRVGSEPEPGNIRTGFPQVRINGTAEWTNLKKITGTRTNLWMVLRELKAAGVTLTPLTETSPESARTLFIRTGPSSKNGASAVQRLVIRDWQTWNEAIRLMNENEPVVVLCPDCNRPAGTCVDCTDPENPCGFKCCGVCNPTIAAMSVCLICGRPEAQCVDCDDGKCKNICCTTCNIDV